MPERTDGDIRRRERLGGLLKYLSTSARALGKLGDPRAARPLKALLKDEMEHVRKEAADALKSITGRTYRR